MPNEFRHIKDVERYLNAGADHISLGSVNFTPWKLAEILK